MKEIEKAPIQNFREITELIVFPKESTNQLAFLKISVFKSLAYFAMF